MPITYLIISSTYAVYLKEVFFLQSYMEKSNKENEDTAVF